MGDVAPDNVEIVRSRYVPLADVDLDDDAWFETFDPELDWRPALTALVEGRQAYRGREGLKQWIRDMGDAFSRFEPEIQRILPAPAERVLVDVIWRSHGVESGTPAEMHVWQLWTLSDGVITHFKAFVSEDEALAAAGLSS